MLLEMGVNVALAVGEKSQIPVDDDEGLCCCCQGELFLVGYETRRTDVNSILVRVMSLCCLSRKATAPRSIPVAVRESSKYRTKP